MKFSTDAVLTSDNKKNLFKEIAMLFRQCATMRLCLFVALTLLLCPWWGAAQTPAPINFIQGSYSVPQTPQATVTVVYSGAQTAGNLNVVVVGWNDATSTVTSVTDSNGNVYTRAVGPTVRAGQASQAIYFAPNIAAAAPNSNIVTVRFSVAAVFPDIRVLEYSGLNPVTPLVATAASTGSSATSSSGSLTTSVSNVLLVAANVVATLSRAPDANFTNRMITSPDGDIVEDRVVTTAGSYSATAALSASGYWVMQMVAFKAAILGPNTAPTILSIAAQVTNEDTATGAIGFTVGDVETAAGSLVVSGSSSNATLVPNGNILFGGSGANRTVTITPAANQNGTATITVTVSDGSLTANTSFQLTVNAVNDPPTITSIANQTTTVGTAVGPISFIIGDVETATSSLVVSGSSSNPTLVPNGNIVFAGSGANRTVTVTPAANQSGTATIAVMVSDGSLTASSGFIVTVGNNGTPATIKFVQGSYSVPQTPQVTVTVTFPNAQSAGNLNVVVVGWNDATATVTSVTDSKGNSYTRAVGPTVLAGQASQSIYFAPNIMAASANSNIVTVRFNVAAVYPDIRILEYSGLDPVSPLHTVTASSGSSATSSSDSLTVSVPNVLLVAGNIVGTTTSGPGPSFTNRMITNPDGDIVEDRVVDTPGTYIATAPLTSSGYWVMQMVAFGAAALPPDTTPPTVAITAPVANATVDSTITVAASASDNVDVVGVQFFLDGESLGSEVPDPPYSTLWDTTTSVPGSHTLTAIARDVAGNTTTSTPVSVTVRATTVAEVGQWSAPSNWPLVAIHATLLPTGDVLAWDGPNQKGAAFVWRPSTNTFTSKNPPDNIFCAGHCLLPDGRLLVVGGHIANFVGIRDANIFDPVAARWTQVRSMAYGRWYPTAITLPDGRVLVVAGDDGCPSCVAAVPEIYNPATNTWVQLPDAANPLPEYPHLFVLPDGRVLATGTFEEAIPTEVLDINTQTWTVVDPVVVDGHSSVMYGLNKFMKSGTSATSDPPYGPAAATTYVLDMSQPQAAWRETAPMAFPRSYHNLTLLPDGSVLATGGEETTDPFDQTQAVFPAELWSPSTETWTTLAPLSVPRFYHSIALLLLDGRVLVAGGGRFGGTAVDDMLNGEIYSPPYLFKGTRPVITTAPNLVSYNSNFSVATPDATRIAIVSLLPLGSVTHHFNANQRYLSLPFQTNVSGLDIQAPVDANVAPPGYYMLFIVDTNGVPSVAKILKIQ
jgi:Galactose oxidase-like, Early set domain/Bacterial Ig domain/Kelch motif